MGDKSHVETYPEITLFMTQLVRLSGSHRDPDRSAHAFNDEAMFDQEVGSRLEKQVFGFLCFYKNHSRS